MRCLDISGTASASHDNVVALNPKEILAKSAGTAPIAAEEDDACADDASGLEELIILADVVINEDAVLPLLMAWQALLRWTSAFASSSSFSSHSAVFAETLEVEGVARPVHVVCGLGGGAAKKDDVACGRIP